MEWFVASFPGAIPMVDREGVRIIRAGRQWSVHWQAARHYRGRLRGAFDAVIDEVNTVPFLAPLWARVPCFLLIFQLAREVWWYESPFPLNALGYAAEPWYLRLYRRTHAFTISSSTREDLLRLGWRAGIDVIPVGIEPVARSVVEPAASPTFAYVGRLAPSKRVHQIVDAFDRYRRGGASGRLWLMGDGPGGYKRRLKRQVAALDRPEEVEFLGRLPANEKHRRMAQATALLMASAREGWGLVVTEAGACGTPTIAYDVPGLRDAIRQEQTGLLIPASPDSMALAMRRLVDDPPLRLRLGSEAERWSATFSYDRAAEQMRERIRLTIG